MRILSKKIVSVSDISAMNLIVGWKFFAFKRNFSILSLFVSHTDVMSSINLKCLLIPRKVAILLPTEICTSFWKGELAYSYLEFIFLILQSQFSKS